jgi:hypothetical protein
LKEQDANFNKSTNLKRKKRRPHYHYKSQGEKKGKTPIVDAIRKKCPPPTPKMQQPNKIRKEISTIDKPWSSIQKASLGNLEYVHFGRSRPSIDTNIIEN